MRGKLLIALGISIPATLVAMVAVAFAGTGLGWITSCQYSHSANDDPIVFPGKPGASHLHDFVGSNATNAFTTTSNSLHTSTTCAMPNDFSGSWTPAVYNNGQRVLPMGSNKNTLFYYRRMADKSGKVVPFPDNFKMILGNAHATSPSQNPLLGSDNLFYKCGPGTATKLAAPPTHCNSPILSISARFPNCGDGRSDSPDHISHVVYPVNNACPADHPYNFPQLEGFFRYNVGSGPWNITLSSGPYYTLHEDYLFAWDRSAFQKFIDRCLNPTNKDCGTNPQ